MIMVMKFWIVMLDYLRAIREFLCKDRELVASSSS